MRNLVIAVVAAAMLAIPAAAQPSGTIPVMMQVERYAEILSVDPPQIDLNHVGGDVYQGHTSLLVFCNYPVELQAMVQESAGRDLGVFEISLQGCMPWTPENDTAALAIDPTAPGGIPISIDVQLQQPNLTQLTFDGNHRVATVYINLAAR